MRRFTFFLVAVATGGWGFGHFADGKPGDATFMKSCFPPREGERERP